MTTMNTTLHRTARKRAKTPRAESPVRKRSLEGCAFCPLRSLTLEGEIV